MRKNLKIRRCYSSNWGYLEVLRWYSLIMMKWRMDKLSGSGHWVRNISHWRSKRWKNSQVWIKILLILNNKIQMAKVKKNNLKCYKSKLKKWKTVWKKEYLSFNQLESVRIMLLNWWKVVSTAQHSSPIWSMIYWISPRCKNFASQFRKSGSISWIPFKMLSMFSNLSKNEKTLISNWQFLSKILSSFLISIMMRVDSCKSYWTFYRIL
jgi:hypothetical protein